MEAASWFGPTKQHETSCTLVDRKFANDSLELQQAGGRHQIAGGAGNILMWNRSEIKPLETSLMQINSVLLVASMLIA